MADTTIQKQGEVFISQSEYDALRLAGNLQSNTKYHITKTPKTGVDSLEQMNLLNGDKTVTYNTTDGMTVSGTARFTYTDGNHDAMMDMEIPIIAGEGIVIDKKASEEKVEVKLDTDLTDGKYVPKVTTEAIVYGTSASDGSPRTIHWNIAEVANTLIMRDSGGRAKIQTPTDAMHIANKKYVDDGFVERKTSTTGLYAYCFDQTGITKTRYISEGYPAYSLVERSENGCVRTADPEGQNDAVNKEYAEANFVPRKPSNFDTTTDYDTEGAYCFTYNAQDKTFTPEHKDFGLGSNNLPIYNHDATLTVVTPGLSGSEMLAGDAASDTYVYNNYVLSEFGHTPSQSAQEQLGLGFTKLAYVADFDMQGNTPIALSGLPNAGTIALRTSEGQLSSTDPTEWYHVANKEYVDTFQTIIILGADD